MQLLRIVSIFALTAAAMAPPPASAPDPLLHHPAPQFSRTDFAQRPIDLATYRGKVVLLNFWATWCAPCQVEMPRFAQWQKAYGPSGLQVIAVSMDDDAATVRNFLQRRPVPFPVLMGDEQLGALYGGILGLPVTFLIDRHGTVAAHFKGEPPLGKMESEVRRLLNQR